MAEIKAKNCKLIINGEEVKPYDFKELELKMLAQVPEGRDPKEWFEEQYLNRPVTFEPHRS